MPRNLALPSHSRMMWALALACTLLLPATAVQAAAPATALVVGTARVQGENLNAAKEEALAQCRLAAVAAVVADLLPMEVMVERMADLNALVYERAGDFVQDYRMLNDTRVEGRYRMLVQVTVAVPLLTERLRGAGLLAGTAARTNQVEVTLQGTDNLANATLFRSGLKDIEGVEGVQTREILTDRMVLVVDYRGTAERLAEALLRQKHPGFSVRVFTVAPERLRVELVPAP